MIPLGEGRPRAVVAVVDGDEQSIRAALLRWVAANVDGDPEQEHRLLSHPSGGRPLAEHLAEGIKARAAKLAADFAPKEEEPPAEEVAPAVTVACFWTPAQKAESVRNEELRNGPPDMVAHERGPGGEMREVFSWGDAVLAFAYHEEEDVWEDISAKVTEERTARRAPTPEEVVDLAADLLEAEPVRLGEAASELLMDTSGRIARDSAGGDGVGSSAPPPVEVSPEPEPPAEASPPAEPDPLEVEADSYWGAFVVLREPLEAPAHCVGCGKPLMPGAWPEGALSVRQTPANPAEYSHRGCVATMLVNALEPPPRAVDETPPPLEPSDPGERAAVVGDLQRRHGGGWSEELKIAGRQLKAACALCGVAIQKGAGYHEGRPRGTRGHGNCVATQIDAREERVAIVAANAGPPGAA